MRADRQTHAIHKRTVSPYKHVYVLYIWTMGDVDIDFRAGRAARAGGRRGAPAGGADAGAGEF